MVPSLLSNSTAEPEKVPEMPERGRITSSWRDNLRGIPRTPREVPNNKKSSSSIQRGRSSGYEWETAKWFLRIWVVCWDKLSKQVLRKSACFKKPLLYCMFIYSISVLLLNQSILSFYQLFKINIMHRYNNEIRSFYQCVNRCHW